MTKHAEQFKVRLIAQGQDKSASSITVVIDLDLYAGEFRRQRQARFVGLSFKKKYVSALKIPAPAKIERMMDFDPSHIVKARMITRAYLAPRVKVIIKQFRTQCQDKDRMIDVVNKITRSRMMAGIRGKHTKPELDLRRALHRLGLRYRLHAPGLPGRPDITLPKHHAAVEVRGCFWHRHEHCSFCTTPASNTLFWKAKFGDTVKRDKRNLEALRKLGWRVAVVWECSVKEAGAEVVAGKVAAWLRSGRSFKEISSRGAKAVRPAQVSKNR